MAPAAPAASYARLVILVAATSLLAGAGLAGMLYGGTFFGEGPCSVYDAASPQHAFCALARQHKPAHLAAYIRGRSTLVLLMTREHIIFLHIHFYVLCQIQIFRLPFTAD